MFKAGFVHDNFMTIMNVSLTSNGALVYKHPMPVPRKRSVNVSTRKGSRKKSVIEVRKILVPVDFSSHSAYALKVACEIAKRFKAQLCILHVLAEPSFGVYIPQSVSEEELREAGFEVAQREMGNFLKNNKKKLSSRNVLYRWGLPSVQILKTAKRCQADLIVMGSLGRTNILDYLVGSTAEHVIQRSKIPVLVVRR